MAITVTVTPGKQFATTEKVTIPKLNQLGQPTFTVTGTVGTSEITDDSVTAAKLVPGALYYADSVAFAAGVYTLTYSPAPTVVDGMLVAFKANANGVPAGAPANLSLTIGASTKKLFKHKTEVMDPGDIVTNQVVEARYDTAGDGGAGAWQMTSHLSRADNYYTATATGTDAYALTLTPPASYTLAIADLEGVPIRWKVPNANTAAVTANVTIGGVALGARALRRNGNVPLASGDLKQNQIVEMVYELVSDSYQLQSQMGGSVLEYVHTDTGTANAYAVTPGTAYTAYSQLQGRPLYFRAANTNTASSTLTVSGLATPPTIKKYGDRNLDASDIKANAINEVVYDGTSFQMQNPPPPSACKAWVRFDGVSRNQTAAITRVSQTATFTLTGISAFLANADKVNITGAVQVEYNGNFVVSNVTANTFDYTVTGSPATPSTGTAAVNTILKATYNVDTITRQSAGEYTLTWTTAFGTTFYTIAGSGKHNSAARGGVISPIYNAGATAFATTNVRIQHMLVDGTPNVADGQEISVLAFGF